MLNHLVLVLNILYGGYIRLCVCIIGTFSPLTVVLLVPTLAEKNEGVKISLTRQNVARRNKHKKNKSKNEGADNGLHSTAAVGERRERCGRR